DRRSLTASRRVAAPIAASFVMLRGRGPPSAVMGKRVATASETVLAGSWQRRAVQPLLFGFGPDGAEQNFLPWLAQNVAAVFTILLSIVLIALLAALVYALWRELRRNTIVLDPLEVPRELIERGYSPAVVTEGLVNAALHNHMVAT